MGKRAVLPAWCKEAKIAMIKKDLDVNDLVKMTGKTRAFQWIQYRTVKVRKYSKGRITSNSGGTHSGYHSYRGCDYCRSE